ARGDAVGEPDVAADAGAPADGDAAEDGGAGVDDDIVLDDGVAGVALDGPAVVVGGEALGPQGDALVEAHPLADDAGLPDDDAGAVVDEEARADLRARVDVDAGRAVGELGDHARDQGDVERVELVRDAVVGDGGQARIAEDRLVRAPGGGVA